MKRLAENFAFWVGVSFVSALLMTSGACPGNDVFCLVTAPGDEQPGQVVEGDGLDDEPRASGARSGSDSHVIPLRCDVQGRSRLPHSQETCSSVSER